MILVCFSVLLLSVTGIAVRLATVRQLEEQIRIIKEQNVNSINDRAYLHEQLENSRAALKRLEVKVKTEMMDR